MSRLQKILVVLAALALTGAQYTRHNPVRVGDHATNTDGVIPTWDASGDPTTFGPGTANQYIASQGAGAEPIFKSILDEDDMSSDSATDVASQQSIKKYVDDSVGTKDFWIVPQSASVENNFTVDSWRSVNINAVQEVFFNFKLHSGCSSVTAADVIIVAENTDTAQWDLHISFGAAGEVNTANDASSLNETQAITDTEIEALDVSSVFAGVAGGDIVSLNFESDFSSLRVVGLNVTCN